MLKKSEVWAIYSCTLTPSILFNCEKSTCRVVKTNPAFCQLAGKPESFFIGLKVNEAFQPFVSITNNEFPDALLDSFALVKSKRKIHDMKVQRVYLPTPKSGSLRERKWRIINIPIMDDKGKLKTIMSSITDVSEQVHLQEKNKTLNLNLSYQQEVYKGIFDHHPNMLFQMDTAGLIISTNEQFRGKTGFLEGEVSKLPFEALLEEEATFLVKGMVRKCLQQEIANFQVSLTTKGKKKLKCNATFMPLVVRDKVVGIYGILMDRTQEIVQQQQNLRKSIYTETIASVTRLLLEGYGGTETIQQAFKLTGNAILADQISFYRVKSVEDQTNIRQIHKWRKKEMPFDPAFSFSADEVGCVLPTLELKRPYKAKISQVKQKAFLAKLEYRGARSIIVLPIFCDRQFWGFITFEDNENERSWNLEDVAFLMTLVANFSVFLETVIHKKALKESQEQLSSIVKNIPGVTYRCRNDDKWLMVYIHADIERYTGYKAEDFISQKINFPEIIHPDDLQRTYDAVSYSGDSQVEYRVVCEDGTIKWFEDRWIKVTDDQGEFLYFDGVMWDITESKEASRQMAFAQRKFDSLIQEGGELYAISTEDARFVFVSSTYKSLLGYEPEKLMQQSVLEFVHPDDLAKVKEEFGKIGYLKHLKLSSFRFKSANGEWRWLESHATDLRNDPAVQGILVNSRDVTERIEENNRLQLMDQIIKNTHDALIVVEAVEESIFEGKIIFTNEAHFKISGYSIEDFKGLRVTDLLHTIKDQKDLEKKTREFDQFGHNIVEVEKIKKSGESYWVNMETFPVRDHLGKISHYIIIQRDITIQKNLEVRASMLDCLKNTFSESCEIKLGLLQVLGVLNRYFKIAVSEAWVVSKDNKKISLVAQCGTGLQGNSFMQDTNGLEDFELGVGIPGLTWQKKGLVKAMDIIDHPDFIRKAYGKKNGLDQVYSIPMVSQGKVYGVLLFFIGHGSGSIVSHFEETLLELGGKLGMELEKKRMVEELNSFFELSTEAMCILHRELFHKVNPTFADLLGYNAEEMVNRPLYDFLHPEDVEPTKAALEDRLLDNNTPYFENRYLTKEGDTVWLSWSTANNPEEPVLYAVGKDITERKIWQDNLMTLNKRLNAAQAIGKVGYWNYNFKQRKMDWTDEVYNIYGKQKGKFEPTFQKALECIHPQDGHLFLIHDDHSATEEFYEYRHRLVMDDGTTKYVYQKINILQDEEGQVHAWEGVIQDITEMRRWQDALNLSHERYKLAMQATSEMLWDWNIHDDFVIRGNSYLAVFGEQFRKSNLQSWLDTVHVEDRERIRNSIETALNDKLLVQWKEEYKMYRKDGQIAYIEDRGIILRGIDGTAERIIGAALDVSKSRKMINRIKQQNLQLREIAWTQSHVVRAPLARLKGLINMMEDENPEEALQVFNDILPLLKSSTDELDEVIKKVVRSSEHID